MTYAAFTSRPASGRYRLPGGWADMERVAEFASTRRAALRKLRERLEPMHYAGYHLNVQAVRLSRCPVWVQRVRTAHRTKDGA